MHVRFLHTQPDSLSFDTGVRPVMTSLKTTGIHPHETKVNAESGPHAQPQGSHSKEKTVLKTLAFSTLSCVWWAENKSDFASCHCLLVMSAITMYLHGRSQPRRATSVFKWRGVPGSLWSSSPVKGHSPEWNVLWQAWPASFQLVSLVGK